MEDTSSLARLARFVPAPDEEMRRRVEYALDETNKEADDDDLGTVRRGGEAESQNRPDEFTARHPYRRPDLCEDELRRQLADNVTRRPRYIDEVELVRVHREVLLHARDVCVADVRRVQVLDEVTETEDRQEGGVQLLDKLDLLLCPGGLVVLCGRSVIFNVVHVLSRRCVWLIAHLPRNRTTMVPSSPNNHCQSCLHLGQWSLPTMCAHRAGSWSRWPWYLRSKSYLRAEVYRLLPDHRPWYWDNASFGLLYG